MQNIDTKAKSQLEKLGYYLFPNYIPLNKIRILKEILLRSNAEWSKELNHPKNINSAYLTSTKFTKDKKDREILFQFIGSDALLEIGKVVFDEPMYFLNTQIFFNPEDPNKLPYWHRDIQYMGISEEKQFERIQRDFVWHFRIPLEPDPGICLVPGSHKRWDTEEERKIRLELEGKKNHEEISNQFLIPHNPGDLLVFSAHLIHKGNYDVRRFSFDILYTNFPEKKETADLWNHFPNKDEFQNQKTNSLFQLV
ncbi:phytanoyl-CoA dioxygenase family protein [Leptospira sp. 2 VSF19]|uniref:Phytanoyl-CoA dioxygenase family protein n=1 Tax=Leptospira soteropolitanensis TaxID=2950025 RepID=A0AAW5VGI8_9LEPT|nr:phytanoyl-CoA dioxygenase family protein [Leptospira soteropolitanensis]MCW7491902.1 phytanoyl-CoA dioxygenase family protein [Leptospira soteropolitanensis]MCW7499486.1 phytanoyl-CoA dioxygenase family protein [Leptospira soteropolitanensis]MCW7520923.1 phytanoyl-CoA dioxygenase family protein [Leptospira soteropolitanensis]MCW7525590.1 phytanoyl-CoA dioxygenase family protein [Leptospira soteropolitanensis]MCW7529456.1 phytanoyl-CoA dioxygenase family protein [Leptospira soteropolitanensi